MKKLAILGLGKIGNYVFQTLDKSEFEIVDGFDLNRGHNFYQNNVLEDIIKNYNGVLACTPFLLNKKIADICNNFHVDYFDLTESVEVTQHVSQLKNSLFVPQCGLAPGMVSIIANKLASEFNTIKDIQIRVGAIPKVVNNQLKYYRTWSTEGLINEYLHSCESIKNNKLYLAEPLMDQETIVIDGVEFQAANTSGGLGTLAHSYLGKAENVNYKTIRHPGHFNIMRVLQQEFSMHKNFDIFVGLFNQNIPETKNDVVYIVINVVGTQDDKLIAKQYKKTISCTQSETAIQIATGSGIMSVLDVWSKGLLDGKVGLVKQEELPYEHITNSKYVSCYK